MINNKSFSILAASVLAATISTNASAEAVYHVKGDTDSAGFSSYTPGGRVYLSLHQVKANSSKTKGTYSYTTLYYNTYKYGVGVSYWSAKIDSKDVTGDGHGKLTLNTDTCAYIPNSSCGYVNVTWTKDSDNVTHTTGVTRIETPYTTTQETGTKTSYRSTVTGTVNGIILSGPYNIGTQGSTKTSNLTITNK